MMNGLGIAITQSLHPATQGAAPGPLPGTLTVSPFQMDYNVHDTGAAFGRNLAHVPVSGTATPETEVQGRFVDATTGTAHTGWSPVATAGTDGIWSGTVSGPRAPGWLRVETRLSTNPAIAVAMDEVCALGHVVGLMGQSEIYRTLHNGGGSSKVPISDPQQVQLASGDVAYQGATGSPVVGFATERVFMAGDTARAPIFSHAVDVVAANSPDKFMFIDMTIPSSGRFQLSDDSEPRRRWQDLISKMDAAGWADGVRPGLVFELWTNEDASTATDFRKAFFPFYTGLQADGVTPYTLSDPITTDVFPGRPGIDTIARKHDHVLWDLTGQGRGLFDAAETKLCIGHHRYDCTSSMKNGLITAGGGSGALDTEMQAQEIIRDAFRDLLADPVFGQIALPQGPEPLNYENGFDNGTDWADFIHPGQGADGLQVFARHLAHGALHGLGLAGTTIPEFDQSLFDPAGAYAEFWSTAGPVTTTRNLRGAADLGTTHPHWTDVFGFEFNDMPVERAELQPNGRVRVYPPAAVGTADWSRDRIFFGRGGGTGALESQSDPYVQGWMNHPVLAASDGGIVGIDGIAVRPMPAPAIMRTPAYDSAALTVSGGAFGQPVAVGPGTTRLRWEMRAAYLHTKFDTYLCGFGNHVYLLIQRNMQMKLYIAGGGANASSPDGGVVVPCVRYDFALDIDYVGRTYDVTVDGQSVLSGAVGGTWTEFNKDRSPNFLAQAGPYSNGTYPPTDTSILEVQRMALYLNGSATPVRDFQASDGSAAWLSDPWYEAGTVVAGG